MQTTITHAIGTAKKTAEKKLTHCKKKTTLKMQHKHNGKTQNANETKK